MAAKQPIALASCSACGGGKFAIVDLDPEGDHPELRYVCSDCAFPHELEDLKRITFPAVPF